MTPTRARLAYHVALDLHRQERAARGHAARDARSSARGRKSWTASSRRTASSRSPTQGRACAASTRSNTSDDFKLTGIPGVPEMRPLSATTVCEVRTRATLHSKHGLRGVHALTFRSQRGCTPFDLASTGGARLKKIAAGPSGPQGGCT